MSMKPTNKQKLTIEKIIESIQDSENFQQALTHTSYCNENNLMNSYENLEFLGDSILNFHTSLFIYNSFPKYSEGQMSKLKQLMVQESTLAELSKEIGLNSVDEKNGLKYLRLGEGEKKNQGADKTSILADIFESFIAALFLEKGHQSVRRFLGLTLFSWVKGKEEMIWDYKTLLQEHCQAQKNRIVYQLKKLVRIGNQQLFVMEVSDKLKTFLEVGKGHSKKEAEQEAAAKAVEKLGLRKKEEK